MKISLLAPIVVLALVGGLYQAQPSEQKEQEEAIPPQGSASEERTAKLEDAISTFLEDWLVKKHPRHSVETFLSHEVMYASLMPSSVFSGNDEQRRAMLDSPRKGITFERAASEMSTYLGAVVSLDEAWSVSSVDDVLATFNKETDPGVWNTLRERDVEISRVKENKIYSFDGSKWRHYSWTMPTIVGYERLVPELVEENKLDIRGVLCRIKLPQSADSTLTFMLWADESPEKVGAWKFWGISPVPTQ